MNLQELRQKHPQYNDLSDEQFTSSFHKKFYSDMPFEDFSEKVGYKQPKNIQWTPDMQAKYEAMNVPKGSVVGGFGKGFLGGSVHGVERLANGLTMGGYGWANRNLGGDFDERKKALNEMGVAGQIAGGATELVGGLLPFVATGGGSSTVQGAGTLAKAGSIANKVNYARPINAFATGRTGIASSVPYLEKTVSGVETLARNGLVGSGMGGLGAGFESNFDPNAMKLGSGIGVGIGLATPVLSKGVGLASQLGRDVSDKLGESVGKSWVSPFFKRTENQINAGIPKFAPRGMNNQELFGDMIKSEANTGLGKINKTQEALYNRAYKNTNMKGDAVTGKTRNALENLKYETTLEGENYLNKVSKNLGQPDYPTAKRYRLGDTSNEFVPTLKSIRRNMEKTHPDFKMGVKDGAIDYDHFLKDPQRSAYITTLPSTFKNPDLSLSGANNNDLRKYDLKRYYNPDKQDHVYDMVIKADDGTVINKIAREGLKGRREFEKILQNASPQQVPAADIQTSLTGNTPNLSDSLSIPQNSVFVKPNVFQLQALKRQIGQDVDRGKANFTKEQVGRVYDAIRDDVFESVSKNAYPDKQDFVTKALANADGYYKAQQMGQSPQSLLKKFAKEKPSSSVASDFLRNLKDRTSNTKAVSTVFKKADNPSLLREEAMSHIRTRYDYNQLSPVAKKIIYGNNLEAAERLFNGAWGDRLGDNLDSIFNFIDKSDFINRTSPFISGFSGRLTN